MTQETSRPVTPEADTHPELGEAIAHPCGRTGVGGARGSGPSHLDVETVLCFDVFSHVLSVNHSSVKKGKHFQTLKPVVGLFILRLMLLLH